MNIYIHLLSFAYSYAKENENENKNERQRKEARSTRYPIWYPTSVESVILCISMPKYTRTHVNSYMHS